MKIHSFKGKHAFLSNFASCQIKLSGMVYPTAEHAYQAAKTLHTQERIMIQRADTPGKAKRMGRLVTLRPNWNEIKLTVMRAILEQKFGSNSSYRQLLLKTGESELIEGNNWGDRFWGAELVGARFMGPNHLGQKLMVGGEFVGLNHLGKMLMDIRSKLQKT